MLWRAESPREREHLRERCEVVRTEEKPVETTGNGHLAPEGGKDRVDGRLEMESSAYVSLGQVLHVERAILKLGLPCGREGSEGGADENGVGGAITIVN